MLRGVRICFILEGYLASKNMGKYHVISWHILGTDKAFVSWVILMQPVSVMDQAWRFSYTHSCMKNPWRALLEVGCCSYLDCVLCISMCSGLLVFIDVDLSPEPPLTFNATSFKSYNAFWAPINALWLQHVSCLVHRKQVINFPDW